MLSEYSTKNNMLSSYYAAGIIIGMVGYVFLMIWITQMLGVLLGVIIITVTFLSAIGFSMRKM